MVRLGPISLDSGGIYRCDVSNEFPDFDTVTTAEILSVVGNTNIVYDPNIFDTLFTAIPAGPVLSPMPVTASPGDRINVTCSVHRSLPAPTLTWYFPQTYKQRMGIIGHFIFKESTRALKGLHSGREVKFES